MTDHSRLVGWSSTYRERLCLHSFAHFNCSLVCSIIHVSFWRERFQIIFQRTAPIIKLWLYTYNNGAAATKPNLDWNNTFSEENKRKFFSSFSFSDLSLSNGSNNKLTTMLLLQQLIPVYILVLLKIDGRKKTFFFLFLSVSLSFSFLLLFIHPFLLTALRERKKAVSQSV